MNFSIEQLNALVAVYEKGSFSEAAIKLNKHRTTIGQVITNLEDQLAVTLFERVGRSARPTTEGELLYRYAQQTVEQARAFDSIALSLSYGQLEHVKIGYCSFIPDAGLVAIRKHLKAQFPTMRVSFLVRTKEEIRDGIVAGDIHLGLVNVDNRKAIHSLSATFLTYARFSIYCACDNALAQVAPDRLIGALKTHKQLVLSSLVQDNVGDKVILSADHETVDDLSLLLGMVEEGIGWALLPSRVVESLMPDLKLKELHFDEMQDYFRFPIALWAPQSKPVLKVQDEVRKAALAYLKTLD